MLLSHRTSVKIRPEYSNIIGHMCYAASKLWNVCNYERHHYKELGMTTSQFVLYLQFKSYQDRGIMNPDVRTIAKNLGTKERQVFEQLHQMMTNHLVEQKMRKMEDGKEDAIYDFSLLINKLALLNENDQEAAVKVENTNSRVETFNQLEAEFGRPLSSMELLNFVR